MKVLIVDDHEIARVGIRKALLETGQFEQVTEACNGTGLFEALASQTFDFLIMDISMPEFNPLREIETIRSTYPSMFILVVSAHDDDAYVQGLLNAGVHGYHLKDQPLKDLTRAIDRILNGEIWLSGSLINKLIAKPMRKTVELSSRQIDIARGLANGLSNKDIAEQLTLSTKTVENHLTRLYRQLNVSSRFEAIKFIHDNPQILGQRGQTMSHQPSSHTYNPPATTGHSILVVDDNQRFRKQLSEVIGRNFPGVMIYEAGSASEVDIVLRQIKPSLVFLDVVLGNDDGIHLTRRIKQDWQSAKIILITAYPDREFHRLGIEAGALALIDKKDLDTPTIKQIIYDILG